MIGYSTNLTLPPENDNGHIATQIGWVAINPGSNQRMVGAFDDREKVNDYCLASVRTLLAKGTLKVFVASNNRTPTVLIMPIFGVLASMRHSVTGVIFRRGH